jgi:hypothetical protein
MTGAPVLDTASVDEPEEAELRALLGEFLHRHA